MIWNSRSRQIGGMLKKRYLIALSIIAFLLVFSQIMIQYTIAKQENDSHVVNISGRQRMLSQRINKAAFGLYISSDENDRKRYLKELNDSLELWEKSHDGLRYGNAEMGLPGENSAKITEMFLSIDKEYMRIVEAAESIETLASDSDYDRDELLRRIRIIQDNEGVFLQGMDAIVFQYDYESKQKIAFIQFIELLILSVTFFTLLMEALFIFRPARKQIESSLEEAEFHRDEMEKLFQTAPTAMILVDEVNLKILNVNRLAKEIFCSQCEDFSKVDIRDLLQLNREGGEELLKKLLSGKPIDNLEVVIENDQYRQVLQLSSNIIRHNGQCAILMGLTDITKLKEAEEVLKKYATTDEMTGLLNKRSGLLVLNNLFARARQLKEDFCVCFLDLDGLKHVNDTYGHEEGDFFIKTVAQAIKSNVTMSDSVFRYGGDEIVILLKNGDSEKGKGLLEEIQKELEKTSDSLNKPYRLQFSFGIASSHDSSAENEEELLAIADKEMYQAKQLKKIRRNQNGS